MNKYGNRHSLWTCAQRWYVEDEYIFGYDEYWWGAFNMNNCKSANNKNCYMAMCRAAKNKKRILHLFKRRLRIRSLKLT